MQGGRSSKDAGVQAEAQALRFLEQRGLQRIECNFSSRRGEIDLVMRDRDTLVFVEVRLRRNSRFGTAAESVTGRKQQRIVQAASHFLCSRQQWRDHPCRFDVLAISGGGEQRQIDWIRDAFRADF